MCMIKVRANLCTRAGLVSLCYPLNKMEVFVCIDSLRPSQQFFSYVGMRLLGLKQRIKCPAQGYNAVPPVRL